MLVELDVEAVVLGHSERRQYFNETDEALARKVPAALAAELEPILCVGESEAARDGGETEAVLERQLQADLAAVESTDLERVVIAYEPIWAIGTGRTATPEQAQEACAFIRDVVRDARRRGRPRPRPLRRLGEAGQRRRAARQARRRRRPGRRRQPRPGRLRRDRRGGGLTRVPAATVPSVALVILDGWGLARAGPRATRSRSPRPPSSTASGSDYPHTSLSAQGRDVGLPDGQMGNSEVGHLNLGAGAVVKQDLARIDEAIADGSFFENEALLAACDRARYSPRGRLHLLGLVSDGGVHSGWEHLEACVELASQEGVPDLVFHAFTDGRDTLPHGGRGYLEELERWLRQAGRIGTVSGRYYAMDRDTRWERTKLAYDAIVHAEGLRAASAAEAIEAAYERDETDEFVKPTVIGDYDGADGGRRRDLRQLPPRPRPAADPRPGRAGLRRVPPRRRAGAGPDHDDRLPQGLALPGRLPGGAAEDDAGRDDRRGRAAASCTSPRPRSTRTSPTSSTAAASRSWRGKSAAWSTRPRDVPTYDHKPEMSARAAAEAFVARWRDGDYRFGIINFANPDMVGHTGVIPAAVAAVETVDELLGEVVEAVAAKGGACIVTADHGNCDHMLEPDGSPNTAHSLNPVPLIVTAEGLELRDGGILADVAPTALDLLGIPQPEAMTGRSLIK